MITPADIEYKEFTKAVRGYKEEEVDAFLDLIIIDMEKLIRENKKLKSELEKTKNQVSQHVNTETSVYETLEAAKSLMNDIAASAERRAEVLLKNAEMEASLITKEARESIIKLTEEGSRLRGRVETFRNRYKRLLEDELENLDYSKNDFFSEFENEFLTSSMGSVASGEGLQDETASESSNTNSGSKRDLTKTIVNLR